MTRPARVWFALVSGLLAAELISACGDVWGQAIVAAPEELSGGAGGAGGSEATGGEVGGDTSRGGEGGSSPEGGMVGASGGATTMGGSVNGGGGSGASGASPDGGTTTGGLGGSSGNSGSGGSAGQPCPVKQVGFVTLPAGDITGGAGGPVVKVSTVADLKKYAALAEPQIIQIDSPITLTEQIRPKSDKTIVGVGKNAELTGGGLYILDVRNVIVQNLKISKVVGADAVTVQNSQHVWIDHCDLSSDLTEPKGTYDDLVAVTHGSDYVTVSWTHFHDHYTVALVGHSNDPSAATEDTDHLTVTFHHNWFSNTQSNNPRVRFGKVHVFNNIYQGVSANAVISQMGAQVYVEQNSFHSVLVPITTQYEDPNEGAVAEVNNIFSADSGPNQITLLSSWVPPYSYASDLDSIGAAELFVPTCAGVGKI